MKNLIPNSHLKCFALLSVNSDSSVFFSSRRHFAIRKCLSPFKEGRKFLHCSYFIIRLKEVLAYAILFPHLKHLFFTHTNWCTLCWFETSSSHTPINVHLGCFVRSAFVALRFSVLLSSFNRASAVSFSAWSVETHVLEYKQHHLFLKPINFPAWSSVDNSHYNQCTKWFLLLTHGRVSSFVAAYGFPGPNCRKPPEHSWFWRYGTFKVGSCSYIFRTKDPILVYLFVGQLCLLHPYSFSS